MAREQCRDERAESEVEEYTTAVAAAASADFGDFERGEGADEFVNCEIDCSASGVADHELLTWS